MSVPGCKTFLFLSGDMLKYCHREIVYYTTWSLLASRAIYTDGGTRVVDGETFAGWGVISQSPHGRIDVMFGPVVTTEAHLAFSGARTHSNNTTEMTVMIEAFSFLGPHGLVTRAFILILCLLLVFAWARSRLVRMCNWHSHFNGP